MAPTILRTGRVLGGTAAGPRNFMVSWVPEASGSAARRCCEKLTEKLKAVRFDECGRPIKTVASTQAVDRRAGERLVAVGDSDCTDFVALVNSPYAIANSGDPDPAKPDPGGPIGDFSLAVDLIERAGEAGAPALGVWAAVIEDCDWRRLWVAGRELGAVQRLRLLRNDGPPKQPPPPHPLPPELRRELAKVEIIASAPPTTLDRHLRAAVDQLLNP